MKLTRIRGVSPSRDTSPTLYATDRGTYVVQGYVVTDNEALASINIPDGETVVEVPPALLREVAEGL